MIIVVNILIGLIIGYAMYMIYKQINFRKLYFLYLLRQKQKLDFTDLLQLYDIIVGLNSQYRQINIVKRDLKKLLNEKTQQQIDNEDVIRKINNLTYLQKYYKILISKIYLQINSFITKGYFRVTQIYNKKALDQYYQTGYFYKKMDQKFKNIIQELEQQSQ